MGLKFFMSNHKEEIEMERVTKVLVMVTLFLVLFGSDGVEGGRKMKSKEKVDEPENFTGSFGGTLPGPITGTFQSPGFSGTFPSPGFTGTFPSPSGLGFGSSSFCSFPGIRCSRPPTPVKPTKSVASP